MVANLATGGVALLGIFGWAQRRRHRASRLPAGGSSDGTAQPAHDS
jgi:hypothetical protein